jgi:hypothetical protein
MNPSDDIYQKTIDALNNLDWELIQVVGTHTKIIYIYQYPDGETDSANFREIIATNIIYENHKKLFM